MAQPLVSVVIPAYNRSSVLTRAVKSVLEQEGIDFELLLVDDASPEPAEELYKEVESWGHRVIRLSENRGPGYARNRGVEVARGDWLAFLDSDDHWLPDKLKKHMESLQGSGRSVGQTDEIWYRDGKRVEPPKAHRISGGDLFRRSLRAVCVSSSTVVLKRELFQQVGGFDERLFVCEDYDLWLRVSAVERFDHLTEALVVKYGGHDDQLSRALPAMDRFRIFAILKGLHQGTFSGLTLEGQDREELAKAELRRKVRILSKGSQKRERDRAVELCRRLLSEAEVGKYDQALGSCQDLIGRWAVRP
jgi:glycosyltransferase involved in cell wall biosynthesis